MLFPKNIKALWAYMLSPSTITASASEPDTTMDKDQESTRPLIKRQPFPARNDFYRAARTRCSIACREYNNQPEDATSEDRARLWNAIVSPVGPTQTPGTPPALALPETFTGTVLKIDSNTTTHEASASANSQILESTALPTSPGSYHLPKTHLNHGLHGAGEEIETRLGPSVPTQQNHSPPPSPRSSLLLTKTPNAEYSAAYAPADTPPASRRASSPDILDRNASDLDKDIVVEAPLTNPFRVNVPYIKPPLFIDYGTNLRIGASTFINRNFTVLDSPIARVSIGEGCLIGPNTTLASITHPLDATERAGPLGAPSFASEISIGDDCWIGASVQILDGVKIGNGCVIGAGSVVTKDIPAGHLAVGAPARVIRRVTTDPADRQLAIVEATPAVSCQPSLTNDRAEKATTLPPETILSPSDLVDLVADDDVCPCRGPDHQNKLQRLEKAVVVLSAVVAILAVKSMFG